MSTPSVGVSHAKTSAMQDDARASLVNAQDSSRMPSGWLTCWDRITCSWRTSQLYFTGEWAKFSGRWPRSGSMRNGIVYQHQPCAPVIGETASGSWPTPTARDWKDGTAEACRNVPANGLLGRVVHMYPTPTTKANQGAPSMMARGSACRHLREATKGGSLNPMWVEWLMGYPLGWTDCEGWGTRSSRRSRNGSRVASLTRKE